MTKELEIEQGLIAKLSDLKYVPRPDIRNCEALELNFRQKFEALNRVRLTDAEFAIRNIDIEKRAAEATERHNQFLKALGLPLLPVRAGED